MWSGAAKNWRLYGVQYIGLNKHRSPLLNFCDLLNHFLQVQDDFRKEFFVIAAWSLWNRQNSLRFGRAIQPLSHICSSASNMLQEFLAAQEENPKEARTAILPHWRPPDADVIKINFDATIFEATNTTGIGVIAWNWRGDW